MARLRILLPGLLLFIAFYNLSSGWVLSTIAIHRVLYYRVSLYPLMPFYYLDYMISAALMIMVSIVYRVRLPALLAFTPLVIYLLSEYLGIASLRALASIPMLISIFIPRRRLLRDAVSGFLAVLIIFELIAIVASLSYFARGGWAYGFDAIISRERQLWALPELVAVAWLLTASVLWLFLKILGREHPLSKMLPENRGGLASIKGRSLLLLSLALLWLEIVLPHLPTVNPGLRPVSVDTIFYRDFLSHTDTHGLPEALKIYYPDRPAYMILIYGLHKLVGNPVILMDIIHPLLAASLLVIVTYIVTKRYFGEKVAGISAILTASGHQVLSFIAGGFQANSLALSIFLLAFIPRGRWIPLGPLILLLGALIHPWTLLIAAPAYIIYLARLSGQKSLIRILAIIYTIAVLTLPLLALDRVSAAITGQSAVEIVLAATGVENALRDPLSILQSLLNIHLLIESTYKAFQLYAWGSINTAPILLLASLSSRPSPATAFLAVIPIAVLPTQGNFELIFRVFLEIPLEICAAQALVSIGDRKLIIAVSVSSVARALILLTGLTPLVGSPWE